jgi:DNA-binding PadR family transcriptional regulator
MSAKADSAFSTLEFHLLLALASGPLHGYAISQAIAEESDDTLTPRAGSLYRVIARLIASGLVAELAHGVVDEPHPGRERRYYELSGTGRSALAEEARRLKRSAALAERRLGLVPRRL